MRIVEDTAGSSGKVIRHLAVYEHQLAHSVGIASRIRHEKNSSLIWHLTLGSGQKRRPELLDQKSAPRGLVIRHSDKDYDI